MNDQKGVRANLTVAALVGGLFSNMKYKSTFLRDNLLINDNVLECSHQAKCAKVVSCLSTCVFPDKVRVCFVGFVGLWHISVGCVGR